MASPTRAGIALEGLRRSAQAIDHRDQTASHIAVGQALFWACALDEQHWKSDDYTRVRDAHPVARHMGVTDLPAMPSLTV